MKKTRALSFLLFLVLLISAGLSTALSLPAHAADDPNSGMKLSKTATPNDDGSYTITLEAYATGKEIISEVTTDIPTDIVLVLDQSGSMLQEMPVEGTTVFEPYTQGQMIRNQYLFSVRHNGGLENLYYELDGSYVEVSVDRTAQYIYTACPNTWKNDSLLSWSEDTYYHNRDNLYALIDGVYQKVTVDRNVRTIIPLNYDYTYTLPDGTVIAESEGRDSVPNFGQYSPLYVAVESDEDASYEYYYQANGQKVVIGTSVGDNTQFNDKVLYHMDTVGGGSTTRLAALTSSVENFIEQVRKKAAGNDGVAGNEDDVDHRIAMVGFATGSYTSGNYSAYENTEVFVGAEQYNYSRNASAHYAEALQDISTVEGYNNVVASAEELDASGATYPNFGLEMAKGILDANPVPEGEKRQRVVILFTDGTPGWSSFEQDVADDAVNQAGQLKDAGVTVYSIGIFAGADATEEGIDTRNPNRLINLYMQSVCSNNGTPRSPSYYLSAADSNTLANIFQQISEEIHQGGSSTTLGAETDIRDIIAPQFQLPEGGTVDSNITLESYKYIGENNWEKNADALGAHVENHGEGVFVTGFDFSENWCGTITEDGQMSYHGNKLVISFKVFPKDGFLGGNDVYTNTSAGVYENINSTRPVFTFERPQVDVLIKDVTVTAQDKDVYLTEGLTADEIKFGAIAKVGNVELDLSKPDENYGLESWQTEYVDITVSYQDAEGNVVTDLTDLREDTTYSISVTVAPKTQGTYTQKEGIDERNIQVYKPQLTFKDSEAWYGDTVPADIELNANLAETKWFHGQTEADAIEMGGAPELALTFTPDASKVADGKINTKQDVPVDVGVKIGQTDVSEDTAFLHTVCSGETCTLSQDKEFLLHINTCQLTVRKTGGAAGEPYVFTVMKDGKKDSEVTVVGNDSKTIYELPVGTYTISEDSGWSWRYSGAEGAAVDLSKDNTSGSITCTNNKTEDYWLNGFSQVIKNIFGTQN